nr:PREDICTED: uncharacterized protein LOC109038429 isoform X2 [Bemisia tabaci]
MLKAFHIFTDSSQGRFCFKRPTHLSVPENLSPLLGFETRTYRPRSRRADHWANLDGIYCILAPLVPGFSGNRGKPPSIDDAFIPSSRNWERYHC